MKRKIEYLWHINGENRTQYWTLGSTQKYLTSPTSTMPAKFVCKNDRGKIMAPSCDFDAILSRRGILKAGYAVNEKGYYHSRREKSYSAISFVDKGKIRVSFDGKKNTANAGDILIIPKNCDCDESVVDLKSGVYWFHFDETVNVGNKTRITKSKNFGDMKNIFDMYSREIYSASPSVPYLENLADILSELLRRDSEIVSSYPLDDTALRSLLEEIKHSLYMEITRESAAKKLNCTAAELDYLCLKHRGLRFAKILLNMRMRKTLELLKKGTLCYGQIAANVGYANTSSLSKVFKAYYGKSLSNIPLR